MRHLSRSNQQTALKGLLLLALVANISWEPAFERLQSFDLAQTAPPETAGSRPTGRATQNKQKFMRGEGAATPVSGGVRPQVATQSADPEINTQMKGSAETEKLTSIGTLEACGMTYRIQYRQKNQKSADGKQETTQTVVTALGGTIDEFSVVQNGQLTTYLAPGPNRNDLENWLRASIKQKLGNACPDVVKQPVQEKPRLEEPKNDRSEREKKRIADGVKNCTLDEDGGRLEGGDRIECNIDRLARLEIDQADASRSASRRRDTAAERQMKSIVADIKDDVKELLLSDDEDDQANASMYIDEAQDELEITGRVNKINKQTITKLQKELQALEVGAETFRLTKEYTSEAEQLRDDFRLTMLEQKRNPNDLSLMFEMEKLRMEHSALSNEINWNLTYGPYAELDQMRHWSLVDRQDYVDFTQPYTGLNQLMIDMLNPNSRGMGTGSALPEYAAGPGHLADLRRSVLQNPLRSRGLSPFRAPNFGSYGLDSMNINQQPTSVFNSRNALSNSIFGNRSTPFSSSGTGSFSSGTARPMFSGGM